MAGKQGRPFKAVPSWFPLTVVIGLLWTVNRYFDVANEVTIIWFSIVLMFLIVCLWAIT